MCVYMICEINEESRYGHSSRIMSIKIIKMYSVDRMLEGILEIFELFNVINGAPATLVR